jgi:hypothetical protein
MRQRGTNHQMAMPQVYPGMVEGVAEAIEVETVAARLMSGFSQEMSIQKLGGVLRFPFWQMP